MIFHFGTPFYPRVMDRISCFLDWLSLVFFRSKISFWPTRTCIPNIPFAYRLKPRPICSMVICPVPISFLKTNTVELLRNTVGEVNSFVGYYCSRFWSLLPNAWSCARSLFFWFTSNHKPVLAIVFVGGLGWAFHRFTERLRPRSHEDKKLAMWALKLLDDHAFLSETFQVLSWERESSMQCSEMPKASLGNFGVWPC